MRRFLLVLVALALALSANVVFAQTTVSGTVTDSDGDPLEGVAVLIKGTTIGMFTDDGGKYSMEVPSDGTTLLFTLLGKTTVEEVIGGRSTINISMTDDVLVLDEVVVTAVGIEANRKTLGYSVQNVESTDIVNARETNLVNALQLKGCWCPSNLFFRVSWIFCQHQS